MSLLAYTSVTHPPTNTTGLARVHRATERAIAAYGLSAVILRNGWYAEHHTAVIGNAVQYGALTGSAGNSRTASVSWADFAEAAAIILTLNDQVGEIYDLTGDTRVAHAKGGTCPLAVMDSPSYHSTDYP